MTCGIYKIKNKKTGQIYIGQSKNIEVRFLKHCNTSLVDIDIAINGVDNFDFSIVEETIDLDEREKFWIEYYNTYKNKNHYNRDIGGNSKYSLWNSNYVKYSKDKMHQHNREPNPCRCFYPKYEGYVIHIGYFHDFVSCEVISQLIEEAIK